MLISSDVKIFLYTPPTDMRKSMVAETLKMNPAEGHLFIFRNRSGNKLKALHYETNCFTLWYRRLEKGKFVFPKNAVGSIEMTQDHFHWLLASDKYSRSDAMAMHSYTDFH